MGETAQSLNSIATDSHGLPPYPHQPHTNDTPHTTTTVTASTAPPGPEAVDRDATAAPAGLTLFKCRTDKSETLIVPPRGDERKGDIDSVATPKNHSNSALYKVGSMPNAATFSVARRLRSQTSNRNVAAGNPPPLIPPELLKRISDRKDTTGVKVRWSEPDSWLTAGQAEAVPSTTEQGETYGESATEEEPSVITCRDAATETDDKSCNSAKLQHGRMGSSVPTLTSASNTQALWTAPHGSPQRALTLVQLISSIPTRANDDRNRSRRSPLAWETPYYLRTTPKCTSRRTVKSQEPKRNPNAERVKPSELAASLRCLCTRRPNSTHRYHQPIDTDTDRIDSISSLRRTAADTHEPYESRCASLTGSGRDSATPPEAWPSATTPHHSMHDQSRQGQPHCRSIVKGEEEELRAVTLLRLSRPAWHLSRLIHDGTRTVMKEALRHSQVLNTYLEEMVSKAMIRSSTKITHKSSYTLARCTNVLQSDRIWHAHPRAHRTSTPAQWARVVSPTSSGLDTAESAGSTTHEQEEEEEAHMCEKNMKGLADNTSHLGSHSRHACSRGDTPEHWKVNAISTSVHKGDSTEPQFVVVSPAVALSRTTLHTNKDRDCRQQENDTAGGARIKKHNRKTCECALGTQRRPSDRCPGTAPDGQTTYPHCPQLFQSSSQHKTRKTEPRYRTSPDGRAATTALAHKSS